MENLSLFAGLKFFVFVYPNSVFAKASHYRPLRQSHLWAGASSSARTPHKSPGAKMSRA